MAIEHTAALFYSWSIRYIVNRAPVTVELALADIDELRVGKGKVNSPLYVRF